MKQALPNHQHAPFLKRGVTLVTKALPMGALAMCLATPPLQASGFFLDRFFGGEVRNSLERGHEFLRQGEYQKASEAYYAEAKSDPKNHEAWYHLGVSYLKAKQFDLASNAFQMAVELESGRVEYQYNLALSLFNGGHVRPSLIKLRHIAKTFPKHDLTWTLLGRCYESLDQFGQAKTSYLQALNVSPHQGQALFLLERLDGDLSPLPLYLGEQVGSAETRGEPEVLRKPRGPIPNSRVMAGVYTNEDEPTGFHHPDLHPILESYHLRRDAHIKGLQPSPIKTWTPSKEETDALRPVPKAPTAPVDLPPPPTPNVSLEDL